MLCGTSLHRQAALRAGEQRHRCAAAANAQSAAPRPVRVSSRMSGGCLGSDQRLARHCSACVLQIIGATNPTAAQPGSVRQKILADWQGEPSASCAMHDQYTQQRWCGAALGLASEPNTGDNGVHASAGPLEGLRERMVPASLGAAEYHRVPKLFGSCRSALACPSEKPGRKARQKRQETVTAPMRCSSALRRE
jgi:hypothetical protein